MSTLIEAEVCEYLFQHKEIRGRENHKKLLDLSEQTLRDNYGVEVSGKSIVYPQWVAKKDELSRRTYRCAYAGVGGVALDNRHRAGKKIISLVRESCHRHGSQLPIAHGVWIYTRFRGDAV